jgi:hypothetical protein
MGLLINDDRKKTMTEAVLDYLKVQSQNLPEVLRKSTEMFNQDSLIPAEIRTGFLQNVHGKIFRLSQLVLL